MDYATHYSEDIIAKSWNIAKELLLLFCSVGIPQNQGTPSPLGSCRTCASCYKCGTSAYLCTTPKTDSLMETFNQRLKHMPHWVIDVKGCNLDLLLMNILFAIQEMLQT